MIYINAAIGAGKTTLAKTLADDLGAKAFLEDVTKIPLLTSFYKNGKLSRDNKSFALQIEFLMKIARKSPDFNPGMDRVDL